MLNELIFHYYSIQLWKIWMSHCTCNTISIIITTSSSIHQHLFHIHKNEFSVSSAFHFILYFLMLTITFLTPSIIEPGDYYKKVLLNIIVMFSFSLLNSFHWFDFIFFSSIWFQVMAPWHHKHLKAKSSPCYMPYLGYH